MGGSDAVLQAGHGIVTACIADDETSAAVVVRTSGQGCSIHGCNLRGGGIGDALHLEIGCHNASCRAVLVGACIQRCARVGRSSYLSAGLNSTGTGQRERADGRLGGDAGLEPLAENLGQGIHDALALGGEGRRAVLALGQVADLRIATGQRDVLPQDDLIGIHGTGHGRPRRTVIEIGGLLIGGAVHGGGHDKDIALLGLHVRVLGEVAGDHAVVGSGQVSFGRGVHRAAQTAGDSFQLFLGGVAGKINSGIVQQNDLIIDLCVDVVVLRLVVHDKIHDVFLRCGCVRDGFRHLKAGMTCLGDGLEPFLLQACSGGFESFEGHKLVVCHISLLLCRCFVQLSAGKISSSILSVSAAETTSSCVIPLVDAEIVPSADTETPEPIFTPPSRVAVATGST